jgi:hypothetical protein
MHLRDVRGLANMSRSNAFVSGIRAANRNLNVERSGANHPNIEAIHFSPPERDIGAVALFLLTCHSEYYAPSSCAVLPRLHNR